VIGYGKGPEKYLRENGYVVKKEDYRGREYEALTGAAVLLFGKNPQRFFQRAQVRVIRYDGTEAKVGTEMNVVKDEIFTGPILKLTNDVLAFVKTQIKEHTYLGPDGRFRTDEQYPEFCWTELCVNSICHRDYSILGTDIQVKLFDDHITVESPGILPGLVRPYNIREMHFSRNPKIALYMRSYKLVKEFGEGVDRMFREMAEAGLPAPEYRQNEFMVYATIRQHGDVVGQLNGELNGELNASQKATLQFIIEHEGCTASGISEMTKIPFSTIDKHVRVLLKVGMIERRGSKKTGGYYPVTKK
jgi:ATP-dependent DNA helicase RecG